MISTIITRRLWIVKNRLFTTFGLVLLLPIFLNIVINLPLKRMVVKPLWNIPHEQWIYPGLVLIVAFIMMIPSIYRDLFELRIHNKLLPSLSLTPVSKPLYLYNFFLAVLIETAAYTVIIMLIYSLLIVPGFGILQYLIMFPFIILFIALGANILITLSLIIDKTTIYIVLMLTFLIFIIFGSGLIIELEYFPEIIGIVLRYLPTGQIMQSMRMALFSDVGNWIIITITIITILVWIYLNGLLFKKRLSK